MPSDSRRNTVFFMHVSGQSAPAEVSHSARPAYRVLVIDDDGCVGAAIKATLTRHRGETELASRACSGIEAFESSKFDVVLVDLFMPGMSGLDAISHIRRQSGIPIIAMSGFQLRDSRKSVDYLGMAMQRGASTCIRKPFALQQLIEAIDRSLLWCRGEQGQYGE
jgi:DNA-binding NtrC family response regulator